MNRGTKQLRATWTVALLALAGALGSPAAARAQQGQAPPPARQSWTADRRAFSAGDVLTVMLDEQTLASQSKGTFATSQRSRDADLSVANSGTARGAVATGASVGTRNVGESRERGDATRATSFRGEISVRVTEIEPGGMLRVEGTKKVDIDGSLQEIALAGLVRPQDVSARNVVDSWRVAELDLRFASKGGLDRPRGGILSKIVGALWP